MALGGLVLRPCLLGTGGCGSQGYVHTYRPIITTVSAVPTASTALPCHSPHVCKASTTDFGCYMSFVWIQKRCIHFNILMKDIQNIKEECLKGLWNNSDFPVPHLKTQTKFKHLRSI